MTGFDHTDWTHTNYAPYEPDTDGTEIQIEPLSFEATAFGGSSFDGSSFDGSSFDPASFDPAPFDAPPVGPDPGYDGVETVAPWPTPIDDAPVERAVE
jgi:uncharacterized protein YjbI with pentapeptide repeats